MKATEAAKNIPYFAALLVGICVWMCILVAISIPAGSLLIAYFLNGKDISTLRPRKVELRSMLPLKR